MIITMEEAKALVEKNKELGWEDLISVFENTDGVEESPEITEEPHGIGISFSELGIYVGLNIDDETLEDEDAFEEVLDSAESMNWSSIEENVESYFVMVFDEDGEEKTILQ